MNQTQTLSTDTALAIVGMSGRFPAATNVAEFWQNIVNSVVSIRSFSDPELLAAGVDPELLKNPNYVKAGTVLEGVDQFDAPFFGFTPREAEGMDPQVRLFLQCAWEALEDAGTDPFTHDGLIGVFAGKQFSWYLWHNPQLIDTGITNIADSLATMVSYKMGLQGPSVSVQTFCSTSLMAVHLACQSLLAYECDMALAGGAAIQVPHGTGYLYQEGGIASPDGQCRTFDAKAQGSIFGDGVGTVAIKRLEDALEDGNHIYAVIRGSAANNDGMLRASYTAPGLIGQAEVIAEALGNAGVDAEGIDYIETHGTATPLGDSVELGAMDRAFRKSTERVGYCAIGSVKPNIGHLDRASGVTGLIKASLALKHRLLPPSLNFETPNPDYDWEKSPFYVNTALRRWERNGHARRAGVSSFGLGGTNVHVVLEEAPERAGGGGRKRPYELLLLSAKSEASLARMTERLGRHLAARPELELADVAYTLQVGRAAFNHRRILVCGSTAEAAERLSAGTELETAVQTGRERPVTLLFPGEAGGAVAEARALARTEAAVAERVAACCAELGGVLGQAVRAALLGEGGGAAEVNGHAAAAAAAAELVAMVALAAQLAAWGIEPAAAAGEGIGELAAAVVAGVLTSGAALRQLASGRAVEAGSADVPLLTAGRGGWLEVGETPDGGTWAATWAGGARLEAGELAALAAGEGVVLELGSGTLGSGTLAERLRQAGAGTRALAVAADAAAGAGLLTAVGRLWLAGVAVEWEALHAGERRLRVPLPTYPFEPLRYWVKANTAPTRAARTTGKKADIGDWFYLPAWQQAKGWPQGQMGDAAGQTWLLFEDDIGIGARVAARLARRGARVFRVRQGSAWASPEAGHYTLDPRRADAYRRLLKTLPAFPTHVLHLWGMGAAETAVLPAGAPTAALQTGFYSLVYLLQAIEHYTDALTIWAVTANAQPVVGGEFIVPERAAVLGACRVIAQENASITCGYVDVGGSYEDEWQRDQLAAQLEAEVGQPPRELAVALRDQLRWVQRFEPVHLAEVAGDTAVFRPRGVYLITGGLGGIGLILARHLAETQQARLILTSRSPFPAPDAWQGWLAAHGKDNDTSAKIRQLQAILALGGNVRVVQADVVDETQMRAVLAEIDQAYGALHGVFHAAGVSGRAHFAPVQMLTVEQCEAHFRAKVHGLYVLENVLAGRDLDFCLLYSSLSSILGGLGFAAYTAANLFIDAFTHRHNSRSPQRWISVNWDTWRIRDDAHAVLGATLAAFEMAPAEALQALRRILADGSMTQIVNSTGDLESRLDQWVRMLSVHQADEPSAADQQRHARPVLMVPYVEPANETEAIVAEVWQQVLGIEPIGTADNFMELGGHSLLAMEVLSQLRHRFQVQLPLTVIFEAPTIAETAVAVEFAIIEELEVAHETEHVDAQA